MDVQRLLDPDVASALALFPFDLGSLSVDVLPAYRSGMGSAPPPELSGAVECRVVEVAGPAGAPDVALRIHRPKALTGALPCVFWMHGGGYVLGSAAMDDLRFDEWCQQFGCVGVSVEYRLAPETPYPGPLDDCYAGLRWVHANASELGIDAGRIGIGGASAGAGLASGLALLARDRAEVPLAFQLLVYPMLDDRLTTASSGWEVPVWPPAANRFGWEAYLGALAADRDAVPPYAAAARATDVSGLPPTLVQVGALDGFLDEDVDYAMRLIRAGVPTELHVYPGAPHGFDAMALGTAVAQQARRDTEAWLGKILTAR